MNNLTVSLELAKKMKELGWSKECYYSYYGDSDPDAVIEYLRPLTKKEKKANPDSILHYDRVYLPTAQEILDELPKRITRKTDKYELDANVFIDGTDEGILEVYYDGKDRYGSCWDDWNSKIFKETSLAEALGQLWCWCKENGYLDTITSNNDKA